MNSPQGRAQPRPIAPVPAPGQAPTLAQIWPTV